MNTEKNVEKNTEKNVDKNAENKTERNTENSTEKNPERNTENSTEKNPERNTENSMEKNPEDNTGEKKSENDAKGTQGTGYLPTRFSLLIRIAVGLYLFYTVYSLREVPAKYTGAELGFFLVIMALFTVIGLLLCVFSGRSLARGKYVGGAMDTPEPEEGEPEAEMRETQMTAADAEENGKK